MEFGRPRKIRRRPSASPRTLSELLAVHERILIIQALQRAGGARGDAAQILGISRSNLWNRIKTLQLDLKVFPSRKSPGRPKKNDT